MKEADLEDLRKEAAKLAEAGIDPASLTTWDAFQTAVLKLRDTLPADEPVVAMGNLDGYAIVHAWGMFQGASSTDAQSIRDWVFQKDGATFDNAENIAALKQLQDWVNAGAGIVGGCCEVGPVHIAKMRDDLTRNGYTIAGLEALGVKS
jgi:hypothetical protein